MSVVITKSKKIYRTALLLEFLFLSVILLLFILRQDRTVFSFILGAVSSFIPHCVFVYWVFFRQIKLHPIKLGVFYKGEILKWLIAISLISVILVCYDDINAIVFFSGYFLLLLLNNLLPMLLFSKFK